MTWYITLKTNISGVTPSPSSLTVTPTPITMQQGWGGYDVGVTSNYLSNPYKKTTDGKEVVFRAYFDTKGAGTLTPKKATGNITITKKGKLGGWAKNGTSSIPDCMVQTKGLITGTSSDGNVTLQAVYSADGSSSAPANLSIKLYDAPNNPGYQFLYGKSGSGSNFKAGETVYYSGKSNFDQNYTAVGGPIYIIKFDLNVPDDAGYVNGSINNMNTVYTADGEYVNEEYKRTYPVHNSDKKRILRDYNIKYWSYDQEGKNKISSSSGGGIPGNKIKNLINPTTNKAPKSGDTITLYAQGEPIMRKIIYKSFLTATSIDGGITGSNPPQPPVVDEGPKSSNYETTWHQGHCSSSDASLPAEGQVYLPNDTELGGHDIRYNPVPEKWESHSVIYGCDLAGLEGISQDSKYKWHPAGTLMYGVNRIPDGVPDDDGKNHDNTWKQSGELDRTFYAVGQPVSHVYIGGAGRPIKEIGVYESGGGIQLDTVGLHPDDPASTTGYKITGGAS